MYSLRKANLNDIDKLIEFRVEFLRELQESPLDTEMEIFRKSLKDFFCQTILSGYAIS